MNRFSRLARIGVPVVLVIAAVAGCGDEGGRAVDAADPITAGSVPGESPDAQLFIDQVRSEFVVRPDLRPGQAEEVPDEPAILLPPPAIDRFAHEGGAFVPRLRTNDGERKPTARVRIAERASQGFRVESTTAPADVSVRLVGTGDTQGEVGRGFVVFRGALGAGTDMIHRAHADGLEDYVRFEQRPATEALVYDLELGDGIAGLRIVANTLEMLDADGTPRMRVTPPSVVDAEGTWHWASLSVEGCAVDTSPVPPWRRATTPPGAARCGLRVDWSGSGVVYPALVDPDFWTNTNAMGTARYSHVAARITGNQVLVAGGLNASLIAQSSAEIWDPSTGTWAATGSMAQTRYAFAGLATSGSATTVLVAGGFSTTCATSPCSNSEEYSTSTATWGSSASMQAGRANFGLSLLSSGTQVLASGGLGTGGNVLPSAELYTLSTSTWAATGSMTTGRYYHSSTALNGSVAVLVAGGRNATSVLASAEKWSGGSWSSAGTQTVTRYGHTASLLSGDDVMTAGGVFNTSGTCIARVEKWTAPSTWTAYASGMTGGSARCFHKAVTLTDGKVLVEGGFGAFGGTALNTATMFDPSAGTWSALSNMGTSRGNHTATLYDASTPNKVLIAGGTNSGGVLSACEFFTH